MQIKSVLKIFVILNIISLIFYSSGIFAQNPNNQSKTDQKVETFLNKHKYKWHDMNIPTSDGKFLYDIIIKNNYKNVVEIGTSSGHSAIWIAWALSKTGGKLITIEINESRHRKALANFKDAGLENYIDARLDDAHKLVPKLKGPIDLVFCDADKDWYKNYFNDIESKIKVDGCYIAHDIYSKKGESKSFSQFVKYLNNQSNYKTTIKTDSTSSISTSYKISR